MGQRADDHELPYDDPDHAPDGGPDTAECDTCGRLFELDDGASWCPECGSRTWHYLP